MKRITLIALLLLTGTVFTYAQKFHFGLKAAPGVAWMKPDTKGVSNGGAKLGFSYGIVTEFAFNKAENYAFATGLDVSYRGGKLDFDSSGSSIKTKLNLQYLEVPITLKMKTNQIGAIKYFGQVGIVPAFNLKAKSKTTIGNITTEDDFKDETKSFDSSFLIALGLEYNLVGTTSGFVSAEFNNGLMDVLDNKNLKSISNLLSLNVGILF